MNPEVEAMMKFQASGSMSAQPGETVHVRGLPGAFVVLAFDGSMYRLRSQNGAELRAGRKAVTRCQ